MRLCTPKPLRIEKITANSGARDSKVLKANAMASRFTKFSMKSRMTRKTISSSDRVSRLNRLTSEISGSQIRSKILVLNCSMGVFLSSLMAIVSLQETPISGRQARTGISALTYLASWHKDNLDPDRLSPCDGLRNKECSVIHSFERNGYFLESLKTHASPSPINTQGSQTQRNSERITLIPDREKNSDGPMG